jgi:cytoskeletal protein CcmA (bactofilin family)
MFGKGKSVSEIRGTAPMQQPQQSAVPQPEETVSSISAQMTVVGKIVCKGVVKIFGVVEGELNASNAFIADGARIQGYIVAEELTIGGRVKGDIHALRVKLQGAAVVEGDIFHRSLSIDENAWFEGSSRPEDNPPNAPSSIEVKSWNPQSQPQPQPPQPSVALFDGKGEFNGEADSEELYRHESYWRFGGMDMRAFLTACVAIFVIGAGGYFALNAMQQPTGLAYATGGARIDPSWSWRSVVPSNGASGATAHQCDMRTASQWIFVDFGDPKGEPSACSNSQ